MKNLHLIAFVMILFTTSCKQYYKISNFEEITQTHEEVAILPFEIFTYGHTPKNLTPEMIADIEENESTLFQSNFFNKVLRSTRRGKKQIRIGLQHYTKTNDILEKNNITVRDSWTMNPEELAQLLGVDAVVKARIEKNQLFSDGLSAGIELSTVLLDVITQNDPAVPYVSNNNKQITSEFSLVSNSGKVLWSIGYNNSADWKRESEELVANINHRSARHFPYRNEK